MKDNPMAELAKDIAVIKEQLLEINKKMDKYMAKTDEHDKDITQLEVELRNFNSFQTVLTFIGTAAASALAWIISGAKK